MDIEQQYSNSAENEKCSFESTELVQGDLKTLNVGLILIVDRPGEDSLSPEESRRLRRKIDWHLLPLLCLIYTGVFITVIAG